MKRVDMEYVTTEIFGGDIHIRSPFKRCRRKMLIASLCAFYAEESWFEENRIGAIHNF